MGGDIGCGRYLGSAAVSLVLKQIRNRQTHRQAAFHQEQGTEQRIARHDHPLGFDHYLPGESLLCRPAYTAVGISRGPGAHHTRCPLLPISFVKEHPVDSEALDELGTCAGCIGEPRLGRALLLSAATAHGTVATAVLLSAAVLGAHAGLPAQPRGPVEEHLSAVALHDGVGRHAHALAHAVQALVVLLAVKPVQPPGGPFPAHKVLGPQRDAPVDRPAAAPGRPGNNSDGPVGGVGDALVEEVPTGDGAGQRQHGGGEVVALVDDDDPVARLGEDFCADCTAAARANYHDVRLDSGRCGLGPGLGLGLGVRCGGWELEEPVAKVKAWLPVHRDVRVAGDFAERGRRHQPAHLADPHEAPGDISHPGKPRVVPGLDDGLPHVGRLLVEGDA